MQNPTVMAALIAAAVAIILSGISLIAQIVGRIMDDRATRKDELFRHRKEALLAALTVIDHVYANTCFDGKAASNPHEWEISLARDAMNQMIIFCRDPGETVTAFAKAIGLYNPDTQKSSQYGPKNLGEFRKQVCRELELDATAYESSEVVWIRALPGSNAIAKP